MGGQQGPPREEFGTLWKFAPGSRFSARPSPPPPPAAPAAPPHFPARGLRALRRPSPAGRGKPLRTFQAQRGQAARRPPRGSPLTQPGRRGSSRVGGEGRAHGRAPAPPPCCSAGRSGSGLGGSCCRNTPPRGAKDRGRLGRGCSRGSGLPARRLSHGLA